jgi:mRNA interferase RelE/StbE
LPYSLKTTPRFEKQLRKLGKSNAIKILKWLKIYIDNSEDPRKHGKQLKHHLKEYWRYRIEDYRVLAKIEDELMIILAVEVGHRKNIYK